MKNPGKEGRTPGNLPISGIVWVPLALTKIRKIGSFTPHPNSRHAHRFLAEVSPFFFFFLFVVSLELVMVTYVPSSFILNALSPSLLVSPLLGEN